MNGSTIDALVSSAADVGTITQNDSESIEQQSRASVFKIGDPPTFQTQVPNGQLEKPLATATLDFDIGDLTFAEHSVVVKNFTGPKISLNPMRHNSIIIDGSHGLSHFPHVTMQVKNIRLS